MIALANKQGQGRSYTCTSCLLFHLFSNFLNKLRSNVKDKWINSGVSLNLQAVGIVEKLFCSCVKIWRQSLRRCETISLSLVFNSQFHAKIPRFVNQSECKILFSYAIQRKTTQDPKLGLLRLPQDPNRKRECLIKMKRTALRPWSIHVLVENT